MHLQVLNRWQLLIRLRLHLLSRLQLQFFFAFANWLARLFAACAGDWSPAGAPAALRKAIALPPA